MKKIQGPRPVSTTGDAGETRTKSHRIPLATSSSSSPIERVLARLVNVKKNPTGWSATCPAHDDGTPSLSISEGDGGRCLLHCHAGCTHYAICAALELEQRDLFPKPDDQISARPHKLPTSQLVASYDYRDEHGGLMFQVQRFNPKTFRQRHPGKNGRWIYSMEGVRRVPFRLPELLLAAPTDWVFITEGEKDADRLTHAGLVATTNPGGAGKWSFVDDSALHGRRICLLPDNDEPGRSHSRDIAERLHGKAAEVRILELPGIAPKGDISDWLDSGCTVKELLELADAAPSFDPRRKSSPDELPMQALSSQSRQRVQPIWPVISDEAFYGILGEVVRRIEPETEADPIAILISLLVGFGNLIGRSVYFVADGAQHYLNLFAVLMGETSKGRKGTAWAHAVQRLAAIEATWATDRVSGGLSSGEGLIWQVRDPIYELRSSRNKGDAEDLEMFMVDSGVDDKRLMLTESEFAKVLRVIERQGSTLSPIVRQAWESGDLKALTKNSPARVKQAHISILGHITSDELRRYLDRTEVANGFGNRFLWVCVRRSKILPEGGQLDEARFSGMHGSLNQAVAFGKTKRELKRDAQARQLWASIYPELSDGKPGLVGAMTSRAEAQVMRLAAIFAVLDCSQLIKVEHLKAGVAIWDYCHSSVVWCFGDAMGDPSTDTILEALRVAGSHGLKRTEISGLFGRHAPAERLARALADLVKSRLAYSTEEKTDGRSAERWFAVEASDAKKAN